MCAEVKRKISPNLLFGVFFLLGLFSGYLRNEYLFDAAESVSHVFINLLKLVSLPIIFLSIVSNASGMENLDQIKRLGQKVIKYTLLTTLISAAVALVLFILIEPVRDVLVHGSFLHEAPQVSGKGYLSFFLNIVPSNIVEPFSENNVIGVLFLALLLSFAIISLPSQHRAVLHSFFGSFYAAIIVITRWVVFLMPLAIWAFTTLFIKEMQQGLEFKSLVLYLICVLAANCIQGFVVLPAMLKFKGISPVALGKAMMPALSLAFFTKSSAATLPMAMRCAEEKGGVSRKVASFVFPLCTTINMNGCAAFILTTVLFVSMSEGMVYSYPEMFLWIILATIAAVGNAGVPMGCYFLASAFLAAMNVPLNIMGVILPFYTLIDMVETSLNVWSDSCVAAIVNQETDEAILSCHSSV